MSLEAKLDVFGDQLILKVSAISIPCLFFEITYDNCIITNPSKLSIPAGSTIRVKATPMDHFGNVIDVVNPPQWKDINSNLTKCHITSNGFVCIYKSIGPVGSFNITSTAESNIDNKLYVLQGNTIVDIIPSEAVSLNITTT